MEFIKVYCKFPGTSRCEVTFLTLVVWERLQSLTTTTEIDVFFMGCCQPVATVGALTAFLRMWQLKETVGIIDSFFQGAFSLLFLADQIGLLFDEFIFIGARVTTLGVPPSQLVP